MITKFTQEQALALIEQAHVNVGHYQGYRFGQSLWNLIPTTITSEYHDTFYSGYQIDVDFFYEKNYDTVINKFYKILRRGIGHYETS